MNVARPCLGLLLAVFACEDGAAGPDAAPAADAGPCGDELFYQVEVLDYSTGVSAPASQTPSPVVTVTEVGDDANTTSVAPNGRAVLCLPRDGEPQVRIESTGHLDHLEVVDIDAYDNFLRFEPADSAPVYVFRSSDLDAMGAVARTPGTGAVFVQVRGDDAAIQGAIDASSDPARVGAPETSFELGDTTTAQARWLGWRNVEIGDGQLALTLSGGLPCGPSGELPVVADTTTATLAVCFIGP